MRQFEAGGVFDRRARELVTATEKFTRKLDYQEARSIVWNAVKEGGLAYKCPVSRVVRYERPRTFPPGLRLSWRFTKPSYARRALPRTRIWHEQDEWDDRHLVEDEYYRTSREMRRIIVPLHRKLSNNFRDWLRSQDICKISLERNQIDVRFETTRGTYIAELKVCHGIDARRGIRAALGQLLEYNLYPGRKPADRWVVVMDACPSGEDRKFLEKLRSELRLPLLLCWREGAEFKLCGDDAL